MKEPLQIANACAMNVQHLQQAQGQRIRQLVIGARLYGNNSLWGWGNTTFGPLISPKERLTDNVVASVVDTATARIGQNKPRPYFLTSGGNWKQQRKAKTLTKLSDAILYENKSYRIGASAQRDAEIFGDGLIHAFIRNGRIRHERVLSAELWIDEVEGAYGNPREMHWERPVDRGVLIAFVEESTQSDKAKKDAVAAIQNADRAVIKNYGATDTRADLVMVRESWHLRSGPNAKDGKHCISIKDALLDPLTDWNHDFFPFARFRWCERPMGYWSQSLCEQLQPKQIELNKLLWVMQRSFQMAGTFKVALEMGSKVVKEHINNDVGVVLQYRGQPPVWFVPQVIPPEYFEQIKYIISSMYDRVGINQMQAAGEKPRGLNSGEAQRVYRDTGNERQKTAEEYNQDAYLDLANMSIALAREVAEEDGFYEASAPQKGKGLEVVRIKAKELTQDDYVSQCFPTSSLPKDPGGRLATVQEFAAAGLVGPRQVRKLMDFPDLEANESLGNASEEILTKVLDAICDDGKYSPPEPTDNLQLAMELVVDYIDRGRALELDGERLDMLRTWKSQVETFIATATPQPPAMPPPGAPMGAGPAGPPLGVPGAPPVSPLLPMAA